MIGILRKFFTFSGKENAKKFKLSIFLGVIYALGEAMKIPAIMIVLRGIIENDISDSVIWTCVAIMAVSFMLSFATKMRSTMLQTEGGYSAAAFKRIEIAQHLRYLPMGYFNSKSLGDITSVTTNTMENLGNIATRVVMLTTQGILNTAIILIMLLFFDVRIGLIGIVGTVIFLLVNAGMQKAGSEASGAKVDADTTMIGLVMEYIQGISEVKSYNMAGKRMKRLEDSIDKAAHANTRMELIYVPYMTIQNSITKITGAIMTMVSIALYLGGHMDIEICIGMTICSFILYASLEQAGNYNSLLKSIDICVDKAQEILDLETMDTDGRKITPVNHDIDVENIEFSYDTRKIIDGISLHIPENTTTAIVGPSGGGKTTLCNLISRFWDVDKGDIKLGGVDVREYSMDSLMKNFSFVFQNVYLFEDTVANNIRFGRENASMDEVIAAAKKACCHDFIMQLPDGYDTVIGEGGATLSGGEKQRISIARAIMKDSPIIILDEATANVDPENEKELTEAVEALTKNKTILMIAHRLKTVRHADKILVVDNGKIVQQGNHDELMKQEGIYRRFIMARESAVGWKL